jgi:HD-GYP domain-containing protein (c-di-GMP phosphodiesterase class II)
VERHDDDTQLSRRDAISDAAAEIRRSAGTQFDPRVVDALLHVLGHASSGICDAPHGALAA